jgi:hypothetical protein
METASTSTQTVKEELRSGYAYIANQIAALIDRFNLDDSRSQILQTYAEICSDSLAFPGDTRPPLSSRINHDGTPVQYAATIGFSHRTLQILGEAGSPEMIGLERMRANRECISTVAQRLGTVESLSSATHLLDALAPENDPDLLADHGGAYWVGTAFTAGSEPYLRIYINARWGNVQDQWRRLHRFAEHFDRSRQWQDIATMLAPDMQPLGTAITLKRDTFPSGRIYLSAYGRSMPFYEELADRYGAEDFLRQIQTFGRCMLGDDYIYPTQTAVCSFGLGENTLPDFKFELCAHCLFASDVDAATRLASWFEIAHLDASDYWDVLGILSEGYLGEKTNDLHCYVGLGLRRGRPYGTIYLKPRMIPA